MRQAVLNSKLPNFEPHRTFSERVLTMNSTTLNDNLEKTNFHSFRHMVYSEALKFILAYQVYERWGSRMQRSYQV